MDKINMSGVGRLKISAFTSDGAEPARGAKITLVGRDADISYSLDADESGQTPELELPAPPEEYSLEPDAPRPYGYYDISISLPGYQERVIQGVQVLSNTTALQRMNLEPSLQEQANEGIISIDPHTLWGNFPPKIPEDDVKPLPPDKGFVVLPEPVIPEFIIVHDGTPSNASAPNYWVPFKDYIKNVASCEIYSTWPESTITSNVLAILSFTLNRVYTEWYRGKGYKFTITSSTAYDHAFSYGRNIFEEISVVVDEMFTHFVTRPNIRQPLLTQYCDGRNVSCPGWMTQWGSKDLGDKGYSSMDILRSFYGSDIFLMQAEEVEGVPSSFPGRELQMGSQGQDVRTIQTQLNAIANNFPAVGKIVVDGYYGEKTREAVVNFQRIFNLPKTGIVDFATWYSISNIYVAVTRMAELN